MEINGYLPLELNTCDFCSEKPVVVILVDKLFGFKIKMLCKEHYLRFKHKELKL
jgi:hypothetical protein